MSEGGAKLKIAVSACLLGTKCGFKGNDFLSEFVQKLSFSEKIEFVPFCPEDAVLGTPRPNLRIVGGAGDDVLAGKARVIDETGRDVTEETIRGARLFLEQVVASGAKAAILTDGSPSCGSNVLLKEEGWPRGGFKRGAGVAAALLRRNGIRVFGGFDEKTVNAFLVEAVGFAKDESLLNLADRPAFQSILS